MRSRPRKKPSPLKEAMTFWIIVLVVAGAVGFAAFRVGRDWLGKRLGSVDMSPGAPRIVAQATGDPEEEAELKREAKAPESAVVKMEDRAPSAAERRQIEEEEASREPQDGAQLHRREAPEVERDEAPSPAPERASEEPLASDSGGDRKWVVTAGSYADRANASKTVARLAARGYKPYTETVTRQGQTLTRVNVAVVSSRAKAEELRNELIRHGMTSGVLVAE